MNIHRLQPRFPQRAAQQGAVLLVALIFLVLLTLLAIGASSGSLLQQRMVTATRSAQLATMSGDTALRGAEWRIWSIDSVVGNHLACDAGDINSQTGCVKYDPTSQPYAANGAVTQFRTDNNAWLKTGVTYKGGTGGTDYTNLADPTDPAIATANIANNPRYIIEDMGPVKPPGSGPQHESGVTGPNNAGANNGGASQIGIHLFRITARATGGTDNVVRVVESTFDGTAN